LVSDDQQFFSGWTRLHDQMQKPDSTVSQVTLPSSPEAEALYAHLVQLPTDQALAELAKVTEPWWLVGAVLRLAASKTPAWNRLPG
jgi:hypothetical protein